MVMEINPTTLGWRGGVAPSQPMTSLSFSPLR